MPARRAVLILSASMGAGHDAAAAELARRLGARGVTAEVTDVLDLLPLRLGAALRGWYGWMVGSAPWSYELIYRGFFTPRGGTARLSPMTALVAARLRRLLLNRRPDEVVSAFHLAAQAAGYLRARGLLPVPSTVLLTDFAAHRLWLHAGNDRYLCPDPATARAVREATGRPASWHAPLVRPEFLGAGWPDGAERRVLVSAGAWGVGGVERTALVLAGSGRYRPVVLCGRNDALRRRLGHRIGASGTVLGWCDDMPALMSGAYALVDNAAGLTCREAMAAGVPVISYLPIPGHGRDGALAMARAGLTVYARDAAELLAALDRVGTPAGRERHAAPGAALFAAAPAESFFTPNGPPPGPGGSAATGPA
ncbi:MGDG synthase family glycosyltransferase [Microtetraspora niveoalba]|uniref:MGDG synthase family glycosyltransferase n=1 Tax=Microtetraspora niveoalba TaxID=46175 RepID=UPI0008360438|nr:glycosyltransferase [Microtetraspora niveoalba]